MRLQQNLICIGCVERAYSNWLMSWQTTPQREYREYFPIRSPFGKYCLCFRGNTLHPLVYMIHTVRYVLFAEKCCGNCHEVYARIAISLGSQMTILILYARLLSEKLMILANWNFSYMHRCSLYVNLTFILNCCSTNL